MELDELKKEYGGLEKKHKLPSFSEVNQIFDIEKIDRESDVMLKTIRKVMVDKIMSSLGFVEMLMNPMNAPRMYYRYIKNMSEEDKKSLDNIYESFSEISTLSLEREIDYDEKGEVGLIKYVFKIWNDMRSEFRRILKNIKNPGEGEKKDRNYFG